MQAKGKCQDPLRLSSDFGFAKSTGLRKDVITIVMADRSERIQIKIIKKENVHG